MMDAFSSDAIPMHLLTSECVEMYWRHLKPDGILAVNISNRNVDLDTVDPGHRRRGGQAGPDLRIAGGASRGTLTATWALITNNEQFAWRLVRRATC